MTKKDFIAIAKALVLYRERTTQHLVETFNQHDYANLCDTIAKVCAQQNVQFDRDKFFKACGV